jgi:hypothetical protein
MSRPNISGPISRLDSGFGLAVAVLMVSIFFAAGGAGRGQ